MLAIFPRLHAQGIVIKGVVKDAYSEEPIALASVQLSQKKIGKLTDSSGGFLFKLNFIPLGDSLVVSYVGYQTKKISLGSLKKDTLYVSVNLERGSIPKEVVIKSKHSKGWMLWRRVVKKKPLNDRARFENYAYELYNKLECI
jgi:hypothetical protein